MQPFGSIITNTKNRYRSFRTNLYSSKHFFMTLLTFGRLSSTVKVINQIIYSGNLTSINQLQIKYHFHWAISFDSVQCILPSFASKRDLWV